MRNLLVCLIATLILIIYPLNSFGAHEVYKPENTSLPKIAAAIDVSGMEDLEGKSPLLAMGLSFFIPGAGQIYNGEILKGIGLFAGIVTLVLLSVFYIEPAAATADKLKKSNSLLDIVTLVTRVGIPVLWVYNWGSAYQSADPIYQKKIKEEEKKKEKEKSQANSLSDNFEIKFLSYNF